MNIWLAVTAEELQAEISPIQRFVTLTLHLRLNSLCYPQHMYRSMGEWVYYNSAAGSFLSKKLCSRLHSIGVDFYSKKRKSSLFEPPFGRLRGNVRISSIARWKARVRLPIRHNWTFFASFYCWDVTDGSLSTWAISEWGVTSIAHFRWKGTSPTNHFWVAEN